MPTLGWSKKRAYFTVLLHDSEILRRLVISNYITITTSYAFHHRWTKGSVQKFGGTTFIFNFIGDLWKFRVMIVPMVRSLP